MKLGFGINDKSRQLRQKRVSADKKLPFTFTGGVFEKNGKVPAWPKLSDETTDGLHRSRPL